MLTKITCGYASATYLYFVAGAIYPIQIITETTVAILLIAWLLLPYILFTVHYWSKLMEKVRSWGRVT